MSNVSATEFYHNDSYDLLGQYQFTIWANDTNNNWNYSTSSFNVKDSIGPMISNLNISPQIQEVNGFVNISVNITDNYDIFPTGTINITSPSGIWQNLSMQRDGNSYYLNRFSDVIGSYFLTIWGNDSEGNWAYATGLFTIRDNEKPALANLLITPSIQEIRNNVNVSQDIVDNYELYPMVRINIIRPDGHGMNYTLFSKGDNFYLNQSYDMVGVHSFTIWTMDTSGNWNFSTGAFEMVDTTKPKIESITVIPSQPGQDEYIMISASVKDNDFLSEVKIIIVSPNGLESNTSMEYDLSNDRYYCTKYYWTTGIYDFTILALDSSSNWNSSSGQFRIEDSTPPAIHVISSVSSEFAGIDIIISAYITDNVDVKTVRIYYTDVDGITRTGIMSQIEGVHRYTIPGQNSEGTLTYYIWVNDAAGNLVKSNTFAVDIQQENEDNDNPTPVNDIVVAALVFLTPIIVCIVFILLLERRRKK
jgi:subtilisin-like proprotein convertase family protein